MPKSPFRVFNLESSIFFISNFSFSQLKQNIQNIPAISGRANEFICDFLGKLFLPVAESLKIEVENEIKLNGGRVSDYQKNINEKDEQIKLLNDQLQISQANVYRKQTEINKLKKEIASINAPVNLQETKERLNKLGYNPK